MRSERACFSGRVGREQAGSYGYIPFEVPGWARTIEVQYAYRGYGEGECTVDIGLFEPGSLELIEGMEHFRGWSGSNKKAFYVSERSATPSYIPGPVRPGVWHVILGFYKVPTGGCEYEVTITVTDEARVEGGSAALEPGEVGRRGGWVRGDFHAHSVHSDGDSTLREIAARARELGLDFVAVTDHNTHSHIAELGYRSAFVEGVLLLRGVEVTTYKGHFNVFGVSFTPDFRLRSESELLRVAQHLRERGAVVSVNHPKPLGPDWEWATMSFAHLVEVFHAIWEFNNYVSLRKWDEQLRRGARLGLIGGSDAHRVKGYGGVSQLGVPTTWVYVDELSERGLLEGLLRQRVFVSKSPEGPRAELAVRSAGGLVHMGGSAEASRVEVVVSVEGAAGQRARLVSDRGVEAVWTLDQHSFSRSVELDARDLGFVRLEVLEEACDAWDPYHMENLVSALTAPVFFRR